MLKQAFNVKGIGPSTVPGKVLLYSDAVAGNRT